MGIWSIGTIWHEEMRGKEDVANIGEKREARLSWLNHVERKAEEDLVMRTWQMEVGGHRMIETPKLRWSDVIFILCIIMSVQ